VFLHGAAPPVETVPLIQTILICQAASARGLRPSPTTVGKVSEKLYGTKPKRRRRAKESASDASSFKPKLRAKKRVDK
jgi:hypothetical protein